MNEEKSVGLADYLTKSRQELTPEQMREMRERMRGENSQAAENNAGARNQYVTMRERGTALHGIHRVGPSGQVDPRANGVYDDANEAEEEAEEKNVEQAKKSFRLVAQKPLFKRLTTDLHKSENVKEPGKRGAHLWYRTSGGKVVYGREPQPHARRALYEQWHAPELPKLKATGEAHHWIQGRHGRYLLTPAIPGNNGQKDHELYHTSGEGLYPVGELTYDPGFIDDDDGDPKGWTSYMYPHHTLRGLGVDGDGMADMRLLMRNAARDLDSPNPDHVVGFGYEGDTMSRSRNPRKHDERYNKLYQTLEEALRHNIDLHDEAIQRHMENLFRQAGNDDPPFTGDDTRKSFALTKSRTNMRSSDARQAGKREPSEHQTVHIQGEGRENPIESPASLLNQAIMRAVGVPDMEELKTVLSQPMTESDITGLAQRAGGHKAHEQRIRHLRSRCAAMNPTDEESADVEPQEPV